MTEDFSFLALSGWELYCNENGYYFLYCKDLSKVVYYNTILCKFELAEMIIALDYTPVEWNLMNDFYLNGFMKALNV